MGICIKSLNFKFYYSTITAVLVLSVRLLNILSQQNCFKNQNLLNKSELTMTLMYNFATIKTLLHN